MSDKTGTPACATHPDSAAVTECAACGRALCEFCRAKSAKRSLCYPCASVEEPLPEAGAEEIFGGARAGTLGPVGYLRVVALVGGAALIGGFLWGKLVSLLGHGSVYLMLLAGAVIGLLTRGAAGFARAPLLPAVAVALTALCLAVHRAVWIWDVLREDRATRRILDRTSLTQTVFPLLGSSVEGLSGEGWAFVVMATGLSAFVCYTVGRQAYPHPALSDPAKPPPE